MKKSSKSNITSFKRQSSLKSLNTVLESPVEGVRESSAAHLAVKLTVDRKAFISKSAMKSGSSSSLLVDEGHRDDVGIRNEEDDGNAIEKDLVDVTLRNEDDDSDTRDPADDNVITSANEDADDAMCEGRSENSPIQRKLSCSNQSQLSISQRLAKASRYSEFKDMNSSPE
eukprot:scaffold1138_cov123-Chaetoceros_neogracile.AAC.3